MKETVAERLKCLSTDSNSKASNEDYYPQIRYKILLKSAFMTNNGTYLNFIKE